MKCKELMVGDWVSDEYGYLLQVTFVSNGYIGFHDDEENPCQLDDKYNQPKPIPLTPEILEKNGFCFVKSSDRDTVWNGWWIYKGLELGVCCLDRNANWPCCINITDSNVPCEYVHQLQHALRLCGLNEVADNFKI